MQSQVLSASEVDTRIDVFDQVSTGIAILAMDGIFLRVNDAFCRLLGYQREQLVGGSLFELAYAPKLELLFDGLGAGLPISAPFFRRDRRFMHRDGRTIWCQLTCTLLPHVPGRPRLAMAQIHDVSDRKAAQEKLRETKDRFRSLAHLASDWIWEQDAQMRFTGFYGEGMERLWDVDPAIALGKQFWEVRGMVPLGQNWARHRTRMLARLPFRNFELRINLPGHETRYVSANGEPVYGPDGAFRGYRGTARDITDRKADEQVRTALAEQLQTTLETIPDAFFAVDKSWRFTFVNPLAVVLMGKTREELDAAPMWDFLPELAEPGHRAELEKAMQGTTARILVSSHARGTLWAVTALPSHQGLSVHVKDVTREVEAENEIHTLNALLEARVQQRTRALEAACKDLETFSYSVAHDLRGPLAATQAFFQLLEQSIGEAASVPQAHFLQRVGAGLAQMDSLSDGLLSLARLSGKEPLREHTDLAELARRHVAFWRAQQPAREVEVEVAPELPAVGDPRLLAQVMGNLVSNAWKFTARREDARIRIGATQRAGETVYFVQDNGAGFDPDKALHLFEPFQRMHTAEEFEGTGIGLAIVHKIVGLHHGRVWAETAPGQGACFYFTLAMGEPQ